MKARHIRHLDTFAVGGGAWMDFITLSNGQVLGIDGSLVCLYDSIDDFYEGREGTWDHVQTIEMNDAPEDDRGIDEFYEITTSGYGK